MTTPTGTATYYQWLIEAGEIVTLRIPVLDASGNPFIVTGYTVDAKIKSADGSVRYTWDSANWSASGSYVELTVPAVDSLAWTFRRARYRVKVIHPTDPTQVHRILEGPLVVSPD